MYFDLGHEHNSFDTKDNSLLLYANCLSLYVNCNNLCGEMIINKMNDEALIGIAFDDRTQLIYR